MAPLPTTKSNRERLKRSSDEMQKIELDYNICIAQNHARALKYLQRTPDVSSSHSSLFLNLVSKGHASYFPNTTLPKELRRKRVSNTKIETGKHSGMLLKKELGQGAFGRVVLMNTSENRRSSTVAIKVQSSADSLAWEFIILKRLEQRMSADAKKSVEYAYARPINFISVADGGMLSMSTVS